MTEQRNQHKQQGNRPQSPVPELIKEIQQYPKLSEMPAEKLVFIAEKLGKYLKENNLKMNQIRRFLDGVRKIDLQFENGKAFNKDLVILLKPKLAYAASRQQSVRPLMEVLEPAINAAQDSYKSFKRLVALIEGILAYHKFYGGGD